MDVEVGNRFTIRNVREDAYIGVYVKINKSLTRLGVAPATDFSLEKPLPVSPQTLVVRVRGRGLVPESFEVDYVPGEELIIESLRSVDSIRNSGGSLETPVETPSQELVERERRRERVRRERERRRKPKRSDGEAGRILDL